MIDIDPIGFAIWVYFGEFRPAGDQRGTFTVQQPCLSATMLYMLHVIQIFVYLLWRRLSLAGPVHRMNHEDMGCQMWVKNMICVVSLQMPYCHYSDVIMGTMVSQIISLTIVYSTVYSDADQRKHQSVTGLCAGNSPVTGEFPAQRASNAENVSIWWRHYVCENTLKMHALVR